MFCSFILGGIDGVWSSLYATSSSAFTAALSATEPGCVVISSDTPSKRNVSSLLLRTQIRDFNHTHRISHDPFRPYTLF